MGIFPTNCTSSAYRAKQFTTVGKWVYWSLQTKSQEQSNRERGSWTAWNYGEDEVWDGKQQAWLSQQQGCCMQQELRRSQLLSQDMRGGRKKRLVWGKGRRRCQGSLLGQMQGRFKSKGWVVLRSVCCYRVGVVGTAQAAEQHRMISDMRDWSRPIQRHVRKPEEASLGGRKSIFSPQLLDTKALEQLTSLV